MQLGFCTAQEAGEGEPQAENGQCSSWKDVRDLLWASWGTQNDAEQLKNESLRQVLDR